MTGLEPDAVRGVLRRNGFRVREETGSDGATFLYGDRHQYTKMATLFTHTGLILFLVAAAVTSRLGDEQGLVVGEGEALTVQPIGTPGLLLVKNNAFEAPGFETGSPTDFTTDLSVYQDGQEIARKTIRVNDPLSVAGYTFHQNGFGPAPHITMKTASGEVLWDGPVPMTDQTGGLPYASVGIPGRDDGAQAAARPGRRRQRRRDRRAVHRDRDRRRRARRSRTRCRRSTCDAVTRRCRRTSTCRSG